MSRLSSDTSVLIFQDRKASPKREMIDFFWNRSRTCPGRAALTPEDYRDVQAFYAARPELSRTPLLSLPQVAAGLEIKQLLIKDEAHRFGTDSFKAVGVMYAVHKLRSTGRIKQSSEFVCATDGNHGRAVARSARELGVRVVVYVPAMMSLARKNALKNECAEVVEVRGNYDDAVREAERHAAAVKQAILIQDTLTGGNSEIVRSIMAGYTQLMSEIAEQWTQGSIPDVVVLQVGVGSFAAAIAGWLCDAFGDSRPLIITCEPHRAACLFRSALAGKPVAVKGDLSTIMSGLSCGEVSSLAFPILLRSVDLFTTIGDEDCEEAVRALALSNPPVEAGESGAAGLGALLAIRHNPALRAELASRGLTGEARVLVFNTEGATDPESYRKIVKEKTESTKRQQ